MTHEIEVRVSPNDICDFCSDPKPVVALRAEDNFLMDEKRPGLPEMRSRGDWLACQECAALIAAEKWEELREHALAAMVKKYPFAPMNLMRLQVKRSHDLFRKHRELKRA
jgi:hypothetical protein